MSAGDDDFISTLSAILANTYNPDQKMRKAAEEALTKYWSLPNAFSGFLQLASKGDGDIHVRMAAALALKNKVRHFWSLETPQEGKAPGDAARKPPSNAFPPMTEEEKDHVKNMVLEALMVETDNTLRKILAEIVRSISDHEWPTRWPTLLPTLVSNISGSDRLRVYNSLIALRKLIKRYEYKAGANRVIMYAIIENTFPPIQALLNNIREMNIIEAAMVMHVSLKIFWSAVMYELPAEAVKFDWDFWFQFLAFTLEKRLPETSEGIEPAGQPIAEDAREKWPWWRMKKWSSRCIYHIMQRFGNPKHVQEKDRKFAVTFRNTTSVSLLGPVMNTLASKAAGGFVTSTVRRNCLTYMSSAVEMAPTYKLIKPHLEFVLFQVIYPTMLMPPDDVALFNQDPVEYVRRIHSSSLDWLDHRHSASNLLERMAKLREKDVVPLVLKFVQMKLDEYQIATGEKKAQMHVEKDGLLQVIGYIANTLVKNSSGTAVMEPFLLNHVVPDFQSENAIVRARCCWVLEWVGNMDFSRLAPTTLHLILEGLMNRLRDPSLAVQNSAACSLRTIIGCEPLRPHIRPIISQIVTDFFRIMTEVESESVLGALKEIVDIYTVEIVPIAPVMVAKLIEQFQGYASQGPEDDDASFAASTCIDAIGTIVEKLDKHRGCLGEVEASCLPLLLTVLSEERYFEYLDVIFNLMSKFTYMSETIGPGMWRCAGLLMVAVDSWATDYLAECCIPLLNLMTRDVAGFYNVNEATGETLARSLFDICEAAINTDNSDAETEGKKSCELLSNFLACSQTLPLEVRRPLIAPVFSLVVNKIDAPFVEQEERTSYYREMAESATIDPSKPLFSPCTMGLRTKLWEVSLALLYCDVDAAVAVLNRDDASRARGEAWFREFEQNIYPSIQSFTGTRLVTLALTQLLRLPPAKLPAFMNAMRPRFLAMVINDVDLMCNVGDDYYDALVHDSHPRSRFKHLYDGEDHWGDSDDDIALVDDEDEGDPDFGGSMGGDDVAASNVKADNSAAGGSPDGQRGLAGVARVPDGGYDEDDDCVATEDDEYYKYLEQGRADADELDFGDRFFDDDSMIEDNLMGMADYQLNAPMDSIDMTRYLLDVTNQPEGQLLGELRGHLAPEVLAKFNGVLDVGARRVAAYQIPDPSQRAAALLATERPGARKWAAEKQGEGFQQGAS